MLEKMLSPRGFKLYLAVFLALFAYAVAGTDAVAWLNRLQAVYLVRGRYFPLGTALVLGTPIFVVSFGVGMLHDYVFGLGVFSSDRPCNDTHER